MLRRHRLEPKLLRLVAPRAGQEQLSPAAEQKDAAPSLRILPTLLIQEQGGVFTRNCGKSIIWRTKCKPERFISWRRHWKSGGYHPAGAGGAESVDIIAAEDTRHTLKLLNHYDIKKPLLSYHEHSTAARGEEIAALLEEGKNVALVSDAGMPLISDQAPR